MKKPWVVGVLSLVPGLGLIVLGRVVLGFALMAFMAILALVGSLDPSGVISPVALTVGLIVWIVQGYYAVVIAQRMARVYQGDSPPQRDVATVPPPSGASLREKRVSEARRAVTQLLSPGEELQVAIHGSTDTTPIGLALLDLATGSSPAPQQVRQLYVGITDDALVIVNVDAFGQPSEIQRVPLAQAKLVEYKQGMLSDQLAIDIGGANLLRLGVARLMRRESQLLANLLPA